MTINVHSWVGTFVQFFMLLPNCFVAIYYMHVVLCLQPCQLKASCIAKCSISKVCFCSISFIFERYTDWRDTCTLKICKKYTNKKLSPLLATCTCIYTSWVYIGTRQAVFSTPCLSYTSRWMARWLETWLLEMSDLNQVRRCMSSLVTKGLYII